MEDTLNEVTRQAELDSKEIAQLHLEERVLGEHVMEPSTSYRKQLKFHPNGSDPLLQKIASVCYEPEPRLVSKR